MSFCVGYFYWRHYVMATLVT